MSTSLGKVNKIQATRFFGGEEKGCCLQLTSLDGYGYVQLTASEIIALMPAFKAVIDAELNRQKKLVEKAIEDNKALQKSIFSDMREVAVMAIAQPVLDMSSLLVLGGEKLEIDPDYD